MVLSSRCDKIKHLDMLKELLEEKYKETRLPCVTTSTFYSKTSKKDRKDALSAQVIFSTYNMVEEALDVPKISVVVLATPKKNVEQAIARGIRGIKQSKDPIILDYEDNHPMWMGFSRARRKHFKKEGFKIKHVQRLTECPLGIIIYDIDYGEAQQRYKKRKLREEETEGEEECPL